jgi:hypothetical protein
MRFGVSKKPFLLLVAFAGPGSSGWKQCLERTSTAPASHHQQTGEKGEESRRRLALSLLSSAILPVFITQLAAAHFYEKNTIFEWKTRKKHVE